MIKELRFLFPIALAFSILGAPSFAVEKPLQFTPQNGFGGRSEGNGTLALLFGTPRSFHVESLGTAQTDGTFRLEQTIQFLGEQPTTRVWVLRTVGPNRYSATLSDAAGPVTGITSGPRLSLTYRAKGPLFMHQELRLMPDGRTIDNVGVISFLGVPVGHLKETIVRKGPGLTSNNSFKPKLLRSCASVAGKACHAGAFATQFGFTNVLDRITVEVS